jgi:thiamine-phosphate pyrophosphorylase
MFKSKPPLVYLISTGAATDANFAEYSARFLELVRAAVKAKVSLVQVREKQLSASKVYELTRQTAAVTKNSETVLLVNDRADIALAADADGVHLTANSLPASVIRQNFGTNFIIGVSAHSLADVQTAQIAGADFAAFSPIFATPNKGKPQGLDKLREVCAAVKDFPLIALGGIDETNYKSTLQAGASGIAAIRFLNDAKNLPDIVKSIRNE